MRVGIDARVLGSHTGGIESYVRNLIRAFPTVDPDGDYTLLLSPALIAAPIPGAERMRRVMVRTHGPSGRIPILTPLLNLTLPSVAASWALARERIDIAHVQQAAPLPFPCRFVVTLHDITYERYAPLFPPDYVTTLRVLVPQTLHRAAAVLTVSAFSKWDIVRRYRVPPEKVTVAHDAPDPIFRPLHNEGQLAKVRERYGTSERFILFVGRLDAIKNLKTVLAAYVRLRRADAVRHKLVLVGPKAWLSDQTFAAARASGYTDDLVFTGYVPDGDLVALYNAADLFVFPSLFEGFGLPPLEAMACGTPVVTSNTSALPEVVGDAALMVDPRDVEALAGAMATVVNDADLRARLSNKGLQRARDFSWDAAARTILDVYRRVCAPS